MACPTAWPTCFAALAEDGTGRARFAFATPRASAKQAKADERNAPGGTMADPPEEIHLKHIRAPDYKEIAADGTLHKIVDNHLVITFYIEDSRVTGEVLKRDGQDPPTYRIAAVEEEKQRLDVVAVRVPTKAILGLAAAVAERLTQSPPDKAKTAKK
jgi:hypothetical protein